MKKRLFALACSAQLMGCLQNEDTGKPGQEGQITIAAQTAANYGMVDVHLKKLYRYYNPTINDHMDHISNLPGTGHINPDHDNYNGLSAFDGDTISGYPYSGSNWYILDPVQPSGVTLPAITPLYRLSGIIGGQYDHMSSSYSKSEGGYAYEYTLGNIFSAQDAELGTFPLNRYYMSWSGKINHLTAVLGEVPAGYTLDGAMGYAWPGSSQKGYVVRTQVGNVNIGTSRNWGGSIVSLIWNGVELINWTPGRALQSAMWYGMASLNDNPTEQGDTYGNGSVAINYGFWGAAGRGEQIWTRTNALQFHDVAYTTDHNYAAEHPVLSGTEISKFITIISDHRIKYEVSFRHSKNAPPHDTNNSDFAFHEPICLCLTQGLFDNVGTLQRKSGVWTTERSTNALVATDQAGYNLQGSNDPRLIIAFNSSANKGSPPTAIRDKTIAILPIGISTGSTVMGLLTSGGNYSSANPGAWPTTKLSWDNWWVPYSKNSVSNYTGYILIGTLGEIENEANQILQSYGY